MRALLAGALLGALVLFFPSVLIVAGTVALAVLAKPVAVAFAVGVLARPFLPRLRRWAR